MIRATLHRRDDDAGRGNAEDEIVEIDPGEPTGLFALAPGSRPYHDKGIMAMIGRKAAVAEVGEHRHKMHGRIAFAAWLGVHAQLLANAGAELNAFLAWADDFYVRPHHRSAALLDPSTVDTPRIHWNRAPRP